jgi:DNA repair exonuclease SbcCD ATPase subunit
MYFRTILVSIAALVLGFPMRTAAGAPQERGRTFRSDRAQDAYVLSRGNHGSTTTSGTLEDLEKARRRLSGEFLWVRRFGKEYVIRDRQTLEEAYRLFAPIRSLDPERAAVALRQSRIEAEQTALEREEERLERESERLGEDPDPPDETARRRLERRRRELEPRMRALEEREREAEELERSIDRREEELEAKAEAELWKRIDAAIARGLARGAEVP